MDVLLASYTITNDNNITKSLTTHIDEQTFILENMDISFVRHARYTPAFWHRHDFFEIIFVQNGTCTNYVLGRSIPMRTGDICIMAPDVTHSLSAFHDEDYIINILIRKSTLHNIFFNFLNSPNILSAFFLNNIYSENGNDYIVFHTGNDNEIRSGFLWMYWESLNRSLYWDQMISYTLMITFGLLIRNYEKSSELPTFNRKSDVQRFALLQFIQENYATVTLEQVAEKFHYTPEHVSRLFKSTTGKTFTQLLQQVRIEKAQILLSDTNLTVADIASQVGYDTTEHFIRLFKKNLKITPTEYRKKGIII